MKKWIWFGLAGLLLICDQATKWLALHHLPPYQPMTVIPGLNWALMFNTGSAFGFFSQSTVWWHPYVFSTFGIVMSVGLCIWMVLSKSQDKLELLALACVLSGALGNVIDRLRLGYVIDFIQIYFNEHYFPVFNIADSAICVGAILLFFVSHKKNPRRKK